MDSRQTASRLAERTGISREEASAILENLGEAIAAVCADLNSAAIPGFGTFSAARHEERIILDPLTMKRTLLPPEIKAEFRPSVVLRHRIAK